MKELAFLICTVISLIISITVGCLLYKKENKKVFNFLNTFPFEMESNKDYKMGLIFRILFGIFISCSTINILYLFIFHYDSNFNTRFIGGVLILGSLMLLGMFLISTKLYKGHIFVSSSFFVLNALGYILYGVYGINYQLPLYLIVISFIIGFILLLLMFSPLLLDWFKLNKKEENDEIITSRLKFNLLAFNEWINIIFFILIILLNTILYL